MSAAWSFIAVPDDLIEYAEAMAEHFDSRGYTVRTEPSETGFPYTPALVCKRDRTRVIVEVEARLNSARVAEWCRYAQSMTGDTRVALGVPTGTTRTSDEEAAIRALRAGLYECGPDGVIELAAPHDLAVNVQLPDPHSLSPKLRKLLGRTYEQFDRSQWREGFEDACQVLEAAARKHLWKSVDDGRIVVLDRRGRRRRLTETQVRKMPMGPLGEAFAGINIPNHADAVVADVLKRINKDRVGVVHHKGTAAAEERLRRNVGRHMWSVIAALKELS
jgi:hypothetical protein